jgi:putative tricarboxylic transport membrane protein
MLQLDRIASLITLACGGLLMFGALQLDLGTPNQPGPGFLPLGVAGLLVALSLAYAASSFRRTVSHDGEGFWPKQGRARLIVVVASLALFCAVLSTVGYILSTFALMLVMFLVADPGKHVGALIKAALSTAITYFLFEKVLMIQFPAGFFGG